MIFEPITLIGTEFIELLLLSLLRSEKVYSKAKQAGLTPEDFVLNSAIGKYEYKVVADLALNRGSAIPAPYDVIAIMLKDKINKNEVTIFGGGEKACELIDKLYEPGRDDPITFDTVEENLIPFIKAKREIKITNEFKDKPDELLANLSRLKMDIDRAEDKEEERLFIPFAKVSRAKHVDFIPTGISHVDISLGGGHALGDYGLLVGYTGCGKTAMGVNFAYNSALSGRNTLYISAEEDPININNRFYAKGFCLDYPSMRNEVISKMEVEQTLDTNPHITDMLSKTLHIDNCRGLDTDFTVQFIIDRVERQYKETGWHPSLIVLDQFEFLHPIVPIKDEPRWSSLLRISTELDRLSEHLVGGKYPLALWVLHQACGETKRIFTIMNIAESKGVCKKADLAVGIGRKNNQSNEFSLFSLKTRHGPTFELDMEGDLNHMRFNFGIEFKNVFGKNPASLTTQHSKNPFLR